MSWLFKLLSYSEPWNTADVYPVYIAENLPILKDSWRITWLVKLLSCYPFYNIAEAYFILLRCWDVPMFETLPSYTLSCYIAELFPIL